MYVLQVLSVCMCVLVQFRNQEGYVCVPCVLSHIDSQVVFVVYAQLE